MSNLNPIVATSIAKKKEIELFKSQISRVELNIEKLEARTEAFTQKQSDFSLQLSHLQAIRDGAVTDDARSKKVVNSIRETFKKIKQIIGKTRSSNDEINSTTKQMARLVKELVYSVELIDALAIAIGKKKAANALIPDDLVAAVSAASAEGNSAVALCLTGLESCNAAKTISDQANEITFLELIESLELYGLITGHVSPVNKCVEEILNYKMGGDDPDCNSLDFDTNIRPHFQALLTFNPTKRNDKHHVTHSLCGQLEKSLIEAKKNLALITEAKERVDRELEQAKGELDKESSILNSLKAGLAAANAAALAA